MTNLIKWSTSKELLVKDVPTK